MQKIKFRNFITLQRGFDLPKKNMVEGPYPVVGSTTIIGYHNKYKVSPPGVMTGRSGSLGKVQFIEQNYWPHNTSLWVKDFKGNNPKYIYYYLSTLGLDRFNSGAGVPTLNRNHLDELEIFVHDISDQRKIAATLSAYDDLIEVNTRRIHVMEAIAQSVYREWFGKVDKKSLQKGWEIVKVEEAIARVSAGKRYDINTVFSEGRVPVLDQGMSGILGYHNEEPGVIASEENPIIVFTNHTCYQKIVQYPFSAIQNVLPFVPKSKSRNIIGYIMQQRISLGSMTTKVIGQNI